MITVQEGVQLAPLTTIRIGGAAQYFAKVESVEDIQQMIAFAAEKDVPYFVLGGGSNVLFADRGFPGVIIKIANSTLVADGTDVMCGAGATLMTLLTYAAENGLSGGERLAGIPGSIGGAVRGNAGAFGTEIKDLMKNVSVLNTETGEVKTCDAVKCDFMYRDSFFKKHPEYIIVSATFAFTPGEKKTIQKDMYHTIAQRSTKQIQDIKSAGSWFVNPAVNSAIQAQFTKETQKESHGGRVPAGWLLQECGMFKKRIGDIQAGTQHANYFINMGNGTAEQAMQLSTLAKTRVRDTFGVQLKEEVVLAGF